MKTHLSAIATSLDWSVRYSNGFGFRFFCFRICLGICLLIFEIRLLKARLYRFRLNDFAVLCERARVGLLLMPKMFDGIVRYFFVKIFFIFFEYFHFGTKGKQLIYFFRSSKQKSSHFVLFILFIQT